MNMQAHSGACEPNVRRKKPPSDIEIFVLALISMDRSTTRRKQARGHKRARIVDRGGRLLTTTHLAPATASTRAEALSKHRTGLRRPCIPALAMCIVALLLSPWGDAFHYEFGPTRIFMRGCV